MKLKFIAGALAGALTISCLVVEQAQAKASVKFYNGGAGYGGIFNGAGTVYADTSGNHDRLPCW